MNKIKTIKISGIRGIRDTLTLSLDKRSLLIYGDNGTGKSSITDAMEWFYRDKIAHLSGEEIGKDSIRNIFLSPDDDAKVEINFSNNKLDCEKSVGKSLRSFASNSSKEFYSYFTESQNENLILRYRDLVEFIYATKGQKLTYLQNIIGFSEVHEMRRLLKSFANKFEKNIRIANYSNKKSEQQRILMECLVQNITSPTQFFEAATKLIKPLKLGKEIKSFKDAREILKSIETKEETHLVEQINFYNKIADNLSEMDGEIDAIHKAYKTFHSTYTELRKDANKIKKLQLLSLLTEGLKVLKKDIFKDNSCPLCQQEKNKLTLIKELNQRIEELKELQEEQNNLEEQSDELSEILQNNLATVNALLREKLLKEKENSAANKIITELKTALTSIEEELEKDIFSTEPIKEPSKIQIEKKNIKALIEQAKKKAKDITDSIKGNLKLQIHTKLSRAIDAYIAHRKIEKEHELMMKQQITFKSLYDDFIKRQEEALTVFLKMFSSDINKHYVAMNPNEKVEDIKLVPMKDKYDELEGITINYKFYSKSQTPPTALLSESHINCLGLSFFLASVKAFNKENGFFILDDVISSFDGNHRTRFIRLLVNEFNDYQVLLLTHEKDFFDIAASEAKRKNWLITSLSWTMEKGASFETPLVDIRTKIEEKFKAKDTDGLGNLVRKYSERHLKQIAHNIEATLAFRFNDKNEDRMMNELLSGVLSKVNKHSPTDLKTKHNIDNLLASPLLIANKTSHDSSLKENIKDLEVFWEDVKTMVKTFYCAEDKCKSFIAMKNLDTVKNKIRCDCGTVCYDWKK